MAGDLKTPGRSIRPRLAFISALRSLAAGDSLSLYWSRVLIPLLSEKFEIELFSDFSGKFEGRDVFHHLSLETRERENSFEAFFYQMEDSRSSGFVRIHLAANPGVCLFHNYFLRDDGPEPILNSAWSDLMLKYREPQQDWPSLEKPYFKTGKAALRETLMSAVPIFSSPQDQIDFSLCGKTGLGGEEGQSFFIPLPVKEEIFEIGATKKTGLPVVLYAGTPGPEHRSHKVLESLTGIQDRCRLVWLVSESEIEQCRKQLGEFDIGNAEISAGRSPERYAELLKTASVSLVPYFSPFGRVSPWFEMSLASGVPAVGTDFGWTDYLPEGVMFRVEPGERESRSMQEVIIKILRDVPFMPCAVEFAREMFTPRMVASEIESAITRSQGLLGKVRTRWSELSAEAEEWVLRKGLSTCARDDISGLYIKRLEAASDELGWRGQ